MQVPGGDAAKEFQPLSAAPRHAGACGARSPMSALACMHEDGAAFARALARSVAVCSEPETLRAVNAALIARKADIYAMIQTHVCGAVEVRARSLLTTAAPLTESLRCPVHGCSVGPAPPTGAPHYHPAVASCHVQTLSL